FGDLRGDVQPGLHDAANHADVDVATGHQQPGQQVEACVLAVIQHRRALALADVDQLRLRHALECLAHRGPGDAEGFGELAFTGERFTGGERALNHLGQQAFEDLVRDRAPGDRL